MTERYLTAQRLDRGSAPNTRHARFGRPRVDTRSQRRALSPQWSSHHQSARPGGCRRWIQPQNATQTLPSGRFDSFDAVPHATVDYAARHRRSSHRTRARLGPAPATRYGQSPVGCAVATVWESAQTTVARHRVVGWQLPHALGRCASLRHRETIQPANE